MQRAAALLLGLALSLAATEALAQRAPAPKERPATEVVRAAELPAEARETITIIRKKGPFPYAKDGAVFGNREGALPPEKRGYYREYTVKTPGLRTRGARRIVAGRGGELYYTEDHYNTFRRIQE